MPTKLLAPAVFATGLVALCWIAAGYVGSDALALSVVVLIGLCYVTGALELHRYRRATTSLSDALRAVDASVDDLPGWTASLPVSLRSAVRQRIEGERVALPGPALTPYLVGLLVLLGMLGTLLGMMTTLRGTGVALQSATDLDAIRTTLAAPVSGLAFAFGTSIAGVAASAMLGLLSALCRRERGEAVQALDAAIATTLRVHSRSHQREEAFRLLQRQVDAMPALVDQMKATMAAIEQQSLSAHERQLVQQAAFHERSDAGHARLAASLEASLMASAAESARAAGAALQPVAEATMSALARHASGLHDDLNQAMHRQLEAVSTSLESSTARVAGLWTDALARQDAAQAQLVQALDGSLAAFATTFEQRSGTLVETVATRFEQAGDRAAAGWDEALLRQSSQAEATAQANERALTAAAGRFEAANDHALAAWSESLARQTAQAEALAARNEQALSAAANALETANARTTSAWTEALSRQATQHETLAQRHEQALVSAAATFEAHAASLVATVQRAHAELQATLEASTQTHARDTLAEISRLVHDAAEAPKAAAAVIAELRQTLSESLVRDTAMLEERGRLLATIETLLGAVNHAAAEQRTAVDALISTSAEALERVATRFSGHVEAGTDRLDAAADRIAAGAIEVASLGDVFGGAVHRFGEANGQLAAKLEAMEGAIERSMARSDEQLAYYVAQAREVVDLSVMTQRQIIGELQRLAQSSVGREPA